MQNKDTKKVIKIVVLLGIIFCAISFLLPWRGMSIGYMGMSMGADFYTWGSHSYVSLPSSYIPTNGGSTSVNMWSIFYAFNLGTPETSNTISGSGSFSYTSLEISNVAISLFILTFIFCILTLVAGIFALKKKKACLIAGITGIISIILFIVAFTVLLSIDPTGTVGNMIPYTFGFFMMIISMIMFFIAFSFYYILASTIKDSPPESYHQLSYEPPKTL